MVFRHKLYRYHGQFILSPPKKTGDPLVSTNAGGTPALFYGHTLILLE